MTTTLTFLAFTIGVAVITYFLTRNTIHDSASGFFLAGHSLGPFVIGLFKPRPEPFIQTHSGDVDITP